jgi:hypothetical protein
MTGFALFCKLFPEQESSSYLYGVCAVRCILMRLLMPVGSEKCHFHISGHARYVTRRFLKYLTLFLCPTVKEILLVLVLDSILFGWMTSRL